VRVVVIGGGPYDGHVYHVDDHTPVLRLAILLEVPVTQQELEDPYGARPPIAEVPIHQPVSRDGRRLGWVADWTERRLT